MQVCIWKKELNLPFHIRTATPLNTSKRMTRPNASVIAARHLLGESEIDKPCLLLSYKPNLCS